ncbi:MAG: hypothetical protein JNL70_25455 [Saprospiraceae bacterium]|nr:hypothetical protein [Saprospiraceae bacterium]
MKKFIFLAVFVAFVSPILAQAIIQGADNATMNSFTKSDEMKRALNASNSRQATGFDNRYEGVKGSPFLFEDWLEGQLTLSDSSAVRDKLKYKFEVVNNTIWLKLNTGEERILYNKELFALELTGKDGTKHTIKKVKLPDATDRNHFSIVLFEDPRFTLVKDVKKIFRKANLEDKGIVTVGNAYDWFEEVTKYYLKTEKYATFEEITLKKSKLTSLIPKSHEKMVVQFCKDNDIGNKLKDADATKLLKYISSLK